MSVLTLVLIVMVVLVLVYALTQIAMPPMVRNVLWIIVAVGSFILLLSLLGLLKA